jgi:hypothetical protein
MTTGESKPVDHTTILVGVLPGGSRTEVVRYSSYESFEQLPAVAQSEQTRREFEAYKQWASRAAGEPGKA